MSKHNLLIKKVKKQILSINNLIESNFNKLKSFKSNIKKTTLNKNNRVFIALGATVMLTLSYLLIPTFYNKNIIQLEIKNQAKKKYNINLEFNDKIMYGLFPKPHFYSKNLSILREERNIVDKGNLKIFISIIDFFKINKPEIKDLIFQNTDFNIYKDDLLFFQKLLKTEPNGNKIVIKNSNIFFKDQNDEILFINKIYNSKFFYDFNNLTNTLTAHNEVFKVPYKITVKSDKFNKKILVKFNAKKIRLDIENEINYDEVKKGLLNILFINKSTSLNYEINENSLNFASEDLKNTYKGILDFKPFYFSADLKFNGLSTKNLFDDDSFFTDLVKSEILSNKNLNANIDLNIKDITNIDELNDLLLKINFEQGNLSFSNSIIMWRENLKITLTESLLTFDDNEINLIGKFTFQFEDLENFYRSFQVKKLARKKIKEIELDFIYNFSQKKIIFDNAKIDNVQSLKVEKYIDNFNENGNKIFNKITFKNFVNNFFSAYAG